MKARKVHYESYSANGDRIARCGQRHPLASITNDLKLVTCKRCINRKANGRYVVTAFESF